MTSARGTAIVMLEVVLAILGAYRRPESYHASTTGPPAAYHASTNGPPAAYHASTNGLPVARKCPTLMHSVRPIRVRLASGWCT